MECKNLVIDYLGYLVYVLRRYKDVVLYIYSTFDNAGDLKMGSSEINTRSIQNGLDYRKARTERRRSLRGAFNTGFFGSLFWHIITFRAGRGFITTARNYFVATINTSAENYPLLDGDDKKPSFAGSTALICALGCLAARFGQLHWCTLDELDVLGTIFKKSGFFRLRKNISKEIERQYKNGLDADYALAIVLKWRLENQFMSQRRLQMIKSALVALIDKHPEWTHQKVWLYETLVEEEFYEIERGSITEQFS